MATLQSVDRRSTWWLVGIAALVLFGPGLIASIRLSFEQRRLTRRLEQLTSERMRLAAEQDRLRSDSTYVEGLIRTTFKYAKPG